MVPLKILNIAFHNLSSQMSRAVPDDPRNLEPSFFNKSGQELPLNMMLLNHARRIHRIGRFPNFFQLRRQSTPSIKYWTSDVISGHTHKKPPIIIHGAGPAGLVLAALLHRKGIPYVLCEYNGYAKEGARSSEDAQNATSFGQYERTTSRAYHVTLDWEAILPLAARLEIDVDDFLKSVGVVAATETAKKFESSGELSKNKVQYRLKRPDHVTVHMRKLLEYLSKLVDGIHGLRYETQYMDMLRNFGGSMLVGADGKFSHVRTDGLGQWPKDDHLYSYPVLEERRMMCLPRSLYDTRISPYLDSALSASLQLPDYPANNIRVETRKLSNNAAFLIFYLSRPSQSFANSDQYFDFHGFSREERDRPQPKANQRFGSNFQRALHDYGSLAPPFNTVYQYARTYPTISFRVISEAVIPNKKSLPVYTRVKGVRIPTVLIGNAAHCVPEIESSDEINRVILDALELGDRIIAAQHDDELFNKIPVDFYEKAFPEWERYLRKWETRIAAFYGQHKRMHRKMEWVKITANYRRPCPEIQIQDVPEVPRNVGDGADVEAWREYVANMMEDWQKKEMRRHRSLQNAKDLVDMDSTGGSGVRRISQPRGRKPGEENSSQPRRAIALNLSARRPLMAPTLELVTVLPE